MKIITTKPTSKTTRPKRSSTPKKRAPRGAGSVVQLPNGKWQARTRRFGTDVKRIADTQTEALTILEQMKHAPQGENRKLGKMRFADWLERYRLEQAPSRKTNTQKLHEYYISVAKPLLGQIPVSSITPADLRKFQNSLIGKAQSTQKQIWQFVAGALRRAFDDEIIAKNPAATVKALQGGSVQERFAWTQAEVIKALEVLRGHHLECLIQFMLTTGVRPGEALALRWTDLNTQDGQVSIVQTVERAGKNPKFGTPKTKNSVRTISIHPSTLIRLEQHREAQMLERRKVKTWREFDLVFPSKKGTPLDHRSLRRVFAFIAKKAEVRLLKPHELRHTYRTLARISKVSSKLVSSIMGHASEKITETYDHTHQDKLEQRRAALPLTDLIRIPNDSLTASESSQTTTKERKSKVDLSDIKNSKNSVQDSINMSEVGK